MSHTDSHRTVPTPGRRTDRRPCPRRSADGHRVSSGHASGVLCGTGVALCGVAVLPVSQSAAAGTRLASRVRSRESNEYSHVRRNRKSAPKMLDGREIRIASIASRFASSVDPEARPVHDRYMRCIDIDILFTLISIHPNLKYSDFRSFVCEAEGEGLFTAPHPHATHAELHTRYMCYQHCSIQAQRFILSRIPPSGARDKLGRLQEFRGTGKARSSKEHDKESSYDCVTSIEWECCRETPRVSIRQQASPRSGRPRNTSDQGITERPSLAARTRALSAPSASRGSRYGSIATARSGRPASG